MTTPDIAHDAYLEALAVAEANGRADLVQQAEDVYRSAAGAGSIHLASIARSLQRIARRATDAGRELTLDEVKALIAKRRAS